MTAYRVTVLHDACTVHDVEADTEQDAIQAAMNETGVTLCHHCSNALEMGDPIRAACVENLDTGASNSEADPDFEVVQLRASIAEQARMIETYLSDITRDQAEIERLRNRLEAFIAYSGGP